MADHQTCNWTGASGKNYIFYVWPRHPDIKSGQMGNYIYTKLNSEGRWVPIYVGQGDLSVRSTSDHHRIECIDKKGRNTRPHAYQYAGRGSARRGAGSVGTLYERLCA